jgi:Ca2+-binding EF-hand superfamily protein
MQALKLVDGQELKSLLAELDRNKDDKISQDEFLRYLTDEHHH